MQVHIFARKCAASCGLHRSKETLRLKCLVRFAVLKSFKRRKCLCVCVCALHQDARHIVEMYKLQRPYTGKRGGGSRLFGLNCPRHSELVTKDALLSRTHGSHHSMLQKLPHRVCVCGNVIVRRAVSIAKAMEWVISTRRGIHTTPLCLGEGGGGIVFNALCARTYKYRYDYLSAICQRRLQSSAFTHLYARVSNYLSGHPDAEACLAKC